MKLGVLVVLLVATSTVPTMVLSEQGASYGPDGSGRLAITTHGTLVKRSVTDATAALGAPRNAVSNFDVAAFRQRSNIAPSALAPPQLNSETINAPLVLPAAFIDASKRATQSLTDGMVDIRDIYFRQSELGLGFSYGYQTDIYSLDVTARTVSARQAGVAAERLTDARFPILETREGYFGTVHAGNVSYAVEVTCGKDWSRCISSEDLELLYTSLLSCEADGQCYAIEETE